MCFSVAQITKKLAGAAAGTAAWVTNVGNEYGQVLVSVLTAAEGDGLANMAAGLMGRYRVAGKAPPKVLYVDRDCCVTVGTSKTADMFHEWHELEVRLDVWHLMRCFARCVTTDSHQLYGLFMVRLSFVIQLARRCRSRGVAETERLLQEVLDTTGPGWRRSGARSAGTSTASRTLQEELYTQEAWEDGDEGFEKEEEEPEESRLLSHHHTLLPPSEPRGAPVTAARRRGLDVPVGTHPRTSS